MTNWLSARLPSKFKLWNSKSKRSFAQLPSKIYLWISKTNISARFPSKTKLRSSKNEAFLRDFLQKLRCAARKRSFCARIPLKTNLWRSKTKLLCETSFKNEALKIKNEAFLRDFLQKWSFESQKRSFCARLPSKLKLWSWKTKLFCETSFKNEAVQLKNQVFVRDFLQKRSFEDQKRSISARLPSQMKLWRSKTKHFCQTSFKNETLKLKNEAFVRDFLQKWSFGFEDQKRSISARLPSKMKLWRSKTKLFCETSFKNEALKHFEAEKRSFSARLPSKTKLLLWRSKTKRLPSKMKLWRSKTKLFCETSFKNEALKLKNEAFLRDFLQKWHVDRTLDLRIPICFNDS